MDYRFSSTTALLVSLLIQFSTLHIQKSSECQQNYFKNSTADLRKSTNSVALLDSEVTSIKITDISLFRPGYIAIFSCPSSSYFISARGETFFDLKVFMTVADDTNLAVLENVPKIVPVDSKDETTVQTLIKMPSSSFFTISLNSADFATLFGTDYKEDCAYDWSALGSLTVAKEGSEITPILSSQFGESYTNFCEVYNMSLVFKPESFVDVSFQISGFNLSQTEFGKGNYIEKDYKLSIKDYDLFMNHKDKPVGEYKGGDGAKFAITNEYQEVLKKLFEQEFISDSDSSDSESSDSDSSSSSENDNEEEWYQTWWFWLIEGIIDLIIIAAIVYCVVKKCGKKEDDELKSVEVDHID